MAVMKTTRDVRGAGLAILRPDGPAKGTGQTQYVADIKPQGMSHAKLLRSPHAHTCVDRYIRIGIDIAVAIRLAEYLRDPRRAITEEGVATGWVWPTEFAPVRSSRISNCAGRADATRTLSRSYSRVVSASHALYTSQPRDGRGRFAVAEAIPPDAIRPPTDGGMA